MNARLLTAEARAKVLGVDQTIGEIAAQCPGATAVFGRLELDFCCGGQVSLKPAASGQGLDASAVLAEVLALQQGNSLPEGACNTGRALSAGVAQFHDDVINHIHLENNVLFSQFDDTQAHI
ncbi:MAG: DUF542 domain-containing protein [Rhodoferax sp.]|uniref:DUF542 domain-containing protein n=1 Tax=Rhodoferax sp. TaxID=50421 RepID=UPI0027178A1B|nr:DUF542 domain-containing protein [Rhodoferax sp.]MDO8449417.1 DUF542 domain-containing protein [Rhodoferax sp.]